MSGLIHGMSFSDYAVACLRMAKQMQAAGATFAEVAGALRQFSDQLVKERTLELAAREEAWIAAHGHEIPEELWSERLGR